MKYEIKRALLSVSNKVGIVEFAQQLIDHGVEIISTGGTKKKLEEAGVKVTPIQNVTGNPEAFGGRMKTISFQIGSSLLYRRDHESDLKDAKALEISPIDLVVCNLYPFDECVEKGVEDIGELVENIDIGGPTMLRAAAKNFDYVSVLSDPEDYAGFLEELKETNTISINKRKELSLKVFRLTSQYDLMISEYLGARLLEDARVETGFEPDFLFKESQELRYGENSHQKATLYKTDGTGIAHAEQLQGKELSYNNLLDADAAWKVAGDAFRAVGSGVCVSVIKHLNPCGLAVGVDSRETLERAWSGDPVSAFGGIIATTSEVSKGFMEFLSDKFIEILIAPSISKEALEICSKKKNLRVLVTPNYLAEAELTLRSISGGILVQDEDEGIRESFNIMTEKTEVTRDSSLCRFGVMACKHLKSNAIALVMKNGETFELVGSGMGQPNRIDSLVSLAYPRAKEKGLDMDEITLVSDAFFPFPDVVEKCSEMGIQKIIQPGGSIKDNDVVSKANELGISMAFTGIRHFRH